MSQNFQPANPGEGPMELPTPALPGDQPATPGEGPVDLPTPSLPGDQPATPGEGPLGLPTPSLPGDQPASPGEGPLGLPTPSLPSSPAPVQPSFPSRPSVIVRRCPTGYQRGTARNNQTFTDLLLQYNVSFDAMRSANPDLPTTRLAPGTVYCAPPAGSRKVCPCQGRSYIMGTGETLYTLVRSLNTSPDVLLRLNPSLAPGDFLPGRVICIPD